MLIFLSILLVCATGALFWYWGTVGRATKGKEIEALRKQLRARNQVLLGIEKEANLGRNSDSELFLNNILFYIHDLREKENS
jgi:hypothetical protein